METNQTQPETMNRASFLRGLGLGSAALMSIYCASGLVACGSKDTAVTPAPVPQPGGGNTNTGLTGNATASAGAINFTLDLTNTNYSKLKNVGEFAAVGDVVVANAKGTYVAVGRICTHAAGNLNYVAANDTFLCDIHGGVYNTNGTVKAAPPTKAVAAYKAAVSGNNLTITA